jgi:putative flippase GtrA
MASRTFDRTSNEMTRFTRFLTVGALGTFLDFGLLTVFKLIGLPTLPANSLSFSAGVINNFTLNSRWTFADHRNGNRRAQFVQFLLVSLVGLAINNAIVFLLEAPFSTWSGDAAWAYAPAKLIATAVVVFWNYFANRSWTFR